jgi:hypothetical protein
MKFNAYDILARNILKTFGTFFIKSEEIKLDQITPADGQIIIRQSGKWVNAADPTLNPYTSFVLNPTSKKLETYKGATLTENLDFPALFPTLTYAAATYQTKAAYQNLWLIRLNSGGTTGDMATRITGLTEGTDYPTGWTLTVGSAATNLVITHGLGRHTANVNVSYTDDLDSNKIKELKGDLGYVNKWGAADLDSVELVSVGTVAKELWLYVFLV